MLILFFITTISSSLILPAWQNSDEPFHYIYIKTLLHENRLPTHTETYQAAHPPVYYSLSALWALPFKSKSPGFLDHWIRFLSVLMGLGALFFIYLLGRDCLDDAWLASGIVAVAAANPAFMVMCSVLNNDPCTFFFSAAAIYLIIRWTRNGGSIRSAALCALAVGLCCLVKFSSTLLVLFFVFYYLLHPENRKRKWMQVFGELFVFGAVFLVVCSWWFILGYLRIGDKVFFNPVTALDPHPLYIPANMYWFAKINMLNFWMPMDYLRGYPVNIPVAIKAGYLGLSCMGIVLILLCILRYLNREANFQKHLVISFAAMILTYIVQMHFLNMKFPVAQARYMFIILGPVLALALIPLKEVLKTRFVHVMYFVAAGGFAMNLIWIFLYFSGIEPPNFHVQ